jgi:hypothetical protein
VAAARPDIVAHGGGEIERRDAIGRADLDNAARLGRAAQLIAEICLVAIERDELVAQELFELVLVRRIRPRTPCLELPEHRDLRVAPGVQAGQQALQHRVLDHSHIAPPSQRSEYRLGDIGRAIVTAKFERPDAAGIDLVHRARDALRGLRRLLQAMPLGEPVQHHGG